MSDNKPAVQPELQPASELEHRTLPIEDVEWREAQNGRSTELTVRGHASVFNRLSLDLGGFRERIAPGAFKKALDANPDVHALWDHDTKFVLARTKNKTLELREDPIGLHFWAKVAPTRYAEDLRVLMERGDVDQASFAFTVGRDEWSIDDKDNVERTILEVDQLYDVTITAQGAYPASDATVVRNLRSRIQTEISDGNLPDTAAAALDTINDPEPQPEGLASDEERTTAPDEDPVAGDSPHPDRVAEETRNALLAAAKQESRNAVREQRELHLRLLKGL